jgi:hypothetical protein
MRSSLAALLALGAVHVLANPIMSTLVTRQEKQELNNEEAICDHDKNATTWYHYGMDQYVINEAMMLDDKTYLRTMKDYLPKLSAESWTCDWLGDTCEKAGLKDHCLSNPKAVYSLYAITHMVLYMRSLNKLFESIALELTAAFPQLAVTFNPKEMTVKPGTSAAGGTGTALFLIGAVAAFAPGVGMLAGSAVRVGANLNKLSTVAYAAGAAANGANLGGPGEQSIELQFLNAASVTDFLSRMIRDVSAGFEKYIKHVLTDQPISDDDATKNHKPRYQDDPAELPQLLKDGTFAAPVPGPSDDMRKNLTAAMAAPAINQMWARAEVVVAIINKDHLPIDPCVGDNLFPATHKHCSDDGNMIVLQATRDVKGSKDPKKYEVGGIEELGRWNMTINDVAQSAIKNQNEHGSKGPKPEDFLDKLVKDSPTNLAREDYLFFSMPVCDFNRLEHGDNVRNALRDECRGDDAMCWFIVGLHYLCPCMEYPQPWPFRQKDYYRSLIGKVKKCDTW